MATFQLSEGKEIDKNPTRIYIKKKSDFIDYSIHVPRNTNKIITNLEEFGNIYLA